MKTSFFYRFASVITIAALSSVMMEHAGGQTATADDNAAVSARANALIRKMTSEEKAAQLVTQFVIPVPGLAPDPDVQAKSGIGSFLFVTDPKETNRLQRLAMNHSRLKIPLLFGFDVIHGYRTIFPVPIAAAASWDTDLVQRNQAIAAKEARAVGIHWAFGPMVDIARDARWGRMVEGAGEDPFLGSAMAVAQVKGFQGPRIGSPGHIIAGPKHLAGYGASIGGRDYDEVSLSEADLWNIYLPPFKAAIDAGAGNIMTAYMGLNGIPAGANRWLLTEVLRKQWGFKGWVVSDSQVVHNLVRQGIASDDADAAIAALHAGVDMEMTRPAAAFATLPAALKNGRISKTELDDAVRRVLEAKIRMGLFEMPYVDESRAEKLLSDPSHLDAARIAAERSAVLLRNEGNLLPLDRTKIRSLAVIGALANSPRDGLGSWAFRMTNPPMQSILEGIREKVGPAVQLTYAPGVAIPGRLYPSPSASLDRGFIRPAPASDEVGIRDAVKAAVNSDVAILVLGEAQDMSGEQASRSTLDLPGRQQELLNAVVATGRPTIVILMNGRPLDLKGTNANAILEIWYPGSRGGTATANLLFGDAAPGGKLPFTWPRNAGQLPIYYSALPSHDTKNGERYWNEPSSPVYPFGFGLSYSEFTFSNARLDRNIIRPGEHVSVSVDLKNSGDRLADEVAQLYIHQRLGTASRPVRELKGFQRISLRPGETRKVTFELGPDELRYWNAAKRDWVIDNTSFDIAIGTNSTAPFTALLRVEE